MRNRVRADRDRLSWQQPARSTMLGTPERSSSACQVDAMHLSADELKVGVPETDKRIRKRNVAEIRTADDQDRTVVRIQPESLTELLDFEFDVVFTLVASKEG